MSFEWGTIDDIVVEGFIRTVGLVTQNATLDRYELNAHELQDGARVYFNATTTPPDITAATLYFVINANTNDFQVSLTLGGAAVDLTKSGTEYCFEYGPLPASVNDFDTGISVDTEGIVGPQGPGGVEGIDIVYNACAAGVYSFTDGTRFATAPSNGAIAGTTLTSSNIFEVQCRAQRRFEFDRIATGNLYVGLTRTITGNINQWDYCVNVSTPARTIQAFPHPANSLLFFESNSASPYPPRPVYWKHGVWDSTDQMIRFRGVNGTMRIYLDDALLYTSRTSIPIGQTFYLAVMFDCSGQSVYDIAILTGSNVTVGSSLAEGEDVGEGCAGPFTLPGGGAIISGMTAIQAAVNLMPALPQGTDDPIPTRFQETAVAWGEFEQRFGTGVAQANTQQKTPIRRFEIDWDGLTTEQAAVLDAHYERSHSGIPFSITNPHTGEVITNCRYASYTRGDHVRYWIQSRAAVIVRYV
jgi:hypothetical protein